MNISELIVNRLEQHGIRNAFGVVGGAIMFITDALRKSNRINSTFTHHEQSAAIAAEAYAKINHVPALVFATAGPGVTNTITGVADAYMDSIPMVLLVGDVRSTIAADFSKQRYNAPQEVNQAALIKPIVKAYVYISPEMNEGDVIDAVDHSMLCAMTGRKGPVCISIPLDMQGKSTDGQELLKPIPFATRSAPKQRDAIDGAITALFLAKKPLLLLGAGVKISGAVSSIMRFIEKFSIPYCVSIGAVDLQNNASPLSCGCVGPTSQRGANLIFNESDCVLALGTSFDQSVTGFNLDGILENKTVYLINIDAGENLRFYNKKIKTIEADVLDCVDLMNTINYSNDSYSNWLDTIESVKSRLTPDMERTLRTTIVDGYISAYDITREISLHLPDKSIVVLGISLDAVSVFNAFEVKPNHQIVFSRNLGPMGWDVPALLGASLAGVGSAINVLITGDGSLMVNIQELAVIAGLKLPVCIFVFNNDGYVSIRTTQANFFGTNFFGCDAQSGLNIPKLESLALGFGFEYAQIYSISDVGNVLALHQKNKKPIIVDCKIAPDQMREPRLVTKVIDGKFQTPVLHEMTPALPPDLTKFMAELFPHSFK